jgi:hypothetical protein
MPTKGYALRNGFLPEGLEEIAAPGTASCGCCG